MYQKKDHTSQKHIVTKSNNIDISDKKSLLEVINKLTNLIDRGDNLFLHGEIGVGKTTFTRFLINNFQIKNKLNKTRLVIHVGYPKTGSSSLQFGLFKYLHDINHLQLKTWRQDTPDEPLSDRLSSLLFQKKKISEKYKKLEYGKPSIFGNIEHQAN